jgi:hypothetical protein
MNDQEFARFQRQGEAIKAHIESRSDSAKREAALVGPRGVELANLQQREKLCELRLFQVVQFGIDDRRTMTCAEMACFDEAMIEMGQIRSKIRAIIG